MQIKRKPAHTQANSTQPAIYIHVQSFTYTYTCTPYGLGAVLTLPRTLTTRVYIYLCMHTHTYTHTRTYILCVFAWKLFSKHNTCLCVYICIYILKELRNSFEGAIYIYIYIYIYTHTHTHIHARICMNTHMFRELPNSFEGAIHTYIHKYKYTHGQGASKQFRRRNMERHLAAERERRKNMKKTLQELDNLIPNPTGLCIR